MLISSYKGCIRHILVLEARQRGTEPNLEKAVQSKGSVDAASSPFVYCLNDYPRVMRKFSYFLYFVWSYSVRYTS